jgi:hypothetical protein
MQGLPFLSILFLEGCGQALIFHADFMQMQGEDTSPEFQLVKQVSIKRYNKIPSLLCKSDQNILGLL